MPFGRCLHAATVLIDGEVLITGGGADHTMLLDSMLYDPSLGSWSSSDTVMSVPRSFHTSSLLSRGKVLVTGGLSCPWPSESCNVTNLVDLYDPQEDMWVTVDSMHDERCSHAASVLSNGKVLVTGGENTDSVQWDTCELYDPLTGKWSRTSSMHDARADHTATILQDGKVLIAGGGAGSCELYDPLTGNWTKTASMNVARSLHTATLLMNGHVLVTGGVDNSRHVTASSELYNPSTNTWAIVGSMQDNRIYFTASLLPNEKVLVAGGRGDGNYDYLNSTELYDPLTRNWTKADDMLVSVGYHTASVLTNGNILVTGGCGFDGDNVYATNVSMLYSSYMEAFTSSDDIENLQALRKLFMVTNEKVSAADEVNLKITNNKQ